MQNFASIISDNSINAIAKNEPKSAVFIMMADPSIRRSVHIVSIETVSLWT